MAEATRPSGGRRAAGRRVRRLAELLTRLLALSACGLAHGANPWTRVALDDAYLEPYPEPWIWEDARAQPWLLGPLHDESGQLRGQRLQLPAGAWLRVHAPEGGCGLPLRVLRGGVEGLWVEQRGRCSDDGQALLFDDPVHALRELRLSHRDGSWPRDWRVEVGHALGRGNAAPARQALPAQGERVHLRHPGGRHEWPLRLGPAHQGELQVRGPARLELQSRALVASEISDWTLQVERLADSREGRRYEQRSLRLSAGAARQRRYAVDGQWQPLSSAAVRWLDVPPGEHRLRFASSRDSLLQIYALQPSDWLLPGLNAPEPAPAALLGPVRQGRAPLAAAHLARVGRALDLLDDGHSLAAAQVLAAPISEAAASASHALARQIDARHAYWTALHPRMRSGGRENYALTGLLPRPARWEHRRRDATHPVQLRAWADSLPELLMSRPVPLCGGNVRCADGGTPGHGALIWNLPPQSRPGRIELLADLPDEGPEPLHFWLQQGEEPPRLLRLERPARADWSHQQPLLGILHTAWDDAHQGASRPVRPDPRPPLRPLARIELPLRVQGDTLRLWSVQPGSRAIGWALRYRAERDFRLAPQDLRARIAARGGGLDLLLATPPRAASAGTATGEARPRAEDADLYQHLAPLRRRIQARAAAWQAAVGPAPTGGRAGDPAQARAALDRGDALGALERLGDAWAYPDRATRLQAARLRDAALQAAGEPALRRHFLRALTVHGDAPAAAWATQTLQALYRQSSNAIALQRLQAHRLLHRPGAQARHAAALADALALGGAMEDATLLRLSAGLPARPPTQAVGGWQARLALATAHAGVIDARADSSDALTRGLRALPEQAVVLQVEGPQQLRLELRALAFDAARSPATMLHMARNGEPYRLPLAERPLSTGLRPENAPGRLAVATHSDLSLGPGRHSLTLRPESGEVYVRPLLWQGDAPAPPLQNPPARRGGTGARARLVAAVQDFAAEPALDAAIRAELAYADLASTGDSEEPGRWMQPVREATRWRGVDLVEASAGLRRERVAGPSSPLQRVRHALLGATPEGAELLAPGERLWLAPRLLQPQTLSVHLRLRDLPYNVPVPASATLRVNGEPMRRFAVGAAPHSERIALLPGEHRISLHFYEAYAQQLLEVRVDSPVPWRQEPGLDLRHWHWATAAEPILLTLEGPALLRIQRQGASQPELRHYAAGRQQLQLQPAPGARRSAYRIEGLELRAVPRPWAPPRRPPDPPAYPDWDSLRLAQAPAVPLRRPPVPDSAGGTWTLDLRGVDRQLGADEPSDSAQPNRFVEAALRYRRLRVRDRVWLRADLLHRQQELGEPTWGLGLRGEWHPDDSPWSSRLRLNGLWQQQPLSAAWLGEAVFDQDYRWDFARRQDLRWRGSLFGRRVRAPEPARPLQTVDADVYTPYKEDHRYGWRSELQYVHAPWRDTRWRASLGANSNEKLDVDHGRAGLSWDQLLGPVAARLDARYRLYLADDDRRKRSERTNFGLELDWQLWLQRRQRLSLRVDGDYELERGRWSWQLGLRWDWHDGRRLRDYPPGSPRFAELRRLHAAGRLAPGALRHGHELADDGASHGAGDDQRDGDDQGDGHV